MKRETKEWIRKAEMDWEAALDLAAAAARTHKVLHDTICFHCQQAAEKYLKALLQEAGGPITRTHDLELILAKLWPDYPELRRLRRVALILNPYAVEYRYQGINARKRQAQAALRHAGKIRAVTRGCLGMPN